MSARKTVTADEALLAVLDALDVVGIPYMIVGSLASNFHGIPRSTRDANVVVELGPCSRSTFVTIGRFFPQRGAPPAGPIS